MKNVVILIAILVALGFASLFSNDIFFENVHALAFDLEEISTKPIYSVYFDSSDGFTLKGAKIIPDQENSALYLDGKNYYAILDSDLPEKLNEFTISVWVKPDYKLGTPSSLSVVSQANAFDLSINNNKVHKNDATLSVYDGIRWHSISSKSKIPEKWTNLSASFSSDSIKIFVNGILENSAILDDNLTYQNGAVSLKDFDYIYSTQDILVGGFDPSLRKTSTVQNHFSGLIDDVTLYDKLLSSDKISSLKNNRIPDTVPEQKIQTLKTIPEKIGTPNEYGFVIDEDNPNDQKIESAASKGFKVKKQVEQKKKSSEIVASLSCNSALHYRTINGTCNNLDSPFYGSAGIELLRKAPSNYTDSVSSPSGESRPSAREISNSLSAQSGDLLNSKGASDFIWQWGQFLDHDLDLTPAKPETPFPIKVPSGDEFFDPFNTGTKVIQLNRSIHNDGNPRQQINLITAFIDASNVYGSDETTAELLRDPQNRAKLKTSEGNLLPENNEGFIAGDIRVNEQIGLTAMHTLFVREHNRIADELIQKHPDFTEDQIYQTARKIVGAKIQVITYNEFLPMLLGKNAIPSYAGYNPSVNPAIANEFSTASFRFGHSLLSPNLLEMDKSGMAHVPLRDAFFNPELFKQVGLDSILRGLATQRAQEVDTMVVDDVRNFLFGPPGSGGFDLASLNIQRGRDHGIADYNSVRAAYGLEKITSFDQISKDPQVQNKLESLYGTVDNIDLWVGGLAEDHAPGAMVGETIQKVLADQFIRLRDGDRFWYQNDPFFVDYKSNMKKVDDTTLYDVISYNTELQGKIQKNVFYCKNPTGGGHNIVHSELRNICNDN